MHHRPLPPPPPRAVPVRDGELSFGWRLVVALTWAAAFFAYAAVWKASTELGLSTWWLGPSGNPNPIVIRIVPFVVPTVLALATIYGVRHIPLYGLGGSLIAALIGVFDLNRVEGLAIVELLIAASTLVVSLAAFTGQFKVRPAAAEPEASTPLPPPAPTGAEPPAVQ